MQALTTKTKKTAIIIVISTIIAGLLIILFISPIAKYLIKKYDEKYTGRQIEMDWVYVNPFTGYIFIDNLEIYESKTTSAIDTIDSVFFSAKGLSANFTLRKLLLKTIDITSVTLTQPRGIIIQNKNNFNFTDLIKKFTADSLDTIPSPIHFNIKNIRIKNGEFYYVEQTIPVSYSIKAVYFESPGKHWNVDTIAIKYSFLSGIGTGSAKGNFTINFKNLDYRLSAVVQKFDLKFIEQYIKDLINYGTFSANLDADIEATGNFTDQENINLKGLLALNDFKFGKTPDDDYASFDKLEVAIEELNPKDHKYLFDSLFLNNPFLKYERYDYLDNLQMMFGRKGSNISAAEADPGRFNLVLEIADYVKVLAKNFFRSNYKINKLVINNGWLKFSDYSPTEKFSIEAKPLYVYADSVNKDQNWVEVILKSDVQPYGEVLVNLRINPKDSGDFDMEYKLQKLPVSMFNPYLITVTSFPFDRGTIELSGVWNVRQGIIKSKNHLLIIDPRVASRIKNKDTKWLPSPLMMFFIKERGNVIDYEIPITGNLKNPRFHLRDVIVDIMGNVFVKPPTTPYRTEIRKTENEIEKTLSLKWEMRQSSLFPNQEKFIRKMVDFLLDKPEATIDVYPIQYSEKEKEYILFFEAKKKYFLSVNEQNGQKLSENDSLKVDKMSVKDSLFLQYLNKQVNDTMLFTIQGKCNKFVGHHLVNLKFTQLNNTREEAFMLEFKRKKLDKRIKIYPGENSSPYNGFSFYKMVYNNDYPEDLIDAYRQMDEYNDVSPRKRFEKKREENRKEL